MSSKINKSQTLLYAGFALLAVVIIAASVLTTAITTQKTASYQRKGMDAYQLAMAGIERAKVELTADWNNWTMDDDSAGIDREPDESEKESLGDGEYWVLVDENDSGGTPLPAGQLRLESNGWVGDAHRVIAVVLSSGGSGTVSIVSGTWQEK